MFYVLKHYGSFVWDIASMCSRESCWAKAEAHFNKSKLRLIHSGYRVVWVEIKGDAVKELG